MGLSIVVGKKGSGKTAFALGVIAEELEHGVRPVITNMMIYKDKLEQWFRDQGKEVNVSGRLLLLDPKDKRMKRWWRLRALDGEIAEWGAFGEDKNWDHCSGQLAVLDEGQKHFRARSWMSRTSRKESPGEPSIDEEAEDYLCQERKTSDDTVVTTPASSLLDVNFSKLSTECVTLDNWYKKRIRGVKPPGRFDVTVWENCPPGPGEEPVARKHFHLDTAGLMACYNTAAGAGFVGSRADIDARTPGGIHLYWLFAGLLALGVGLWFGLHVGMHQMTKWFMHKMDRDGVTPVAVVKTNAVKVDVRPSFAVRTNVLGAILYRPVATVEGQRFRGLVHGSAGWVVVWEDGTMGKVERVKELVGGKWLLDGEECRAMGVGASLGGRAEGERVVRSAGPLRARAREPERPEQQK